MPETYTRLLNQSPPCVFVDLNAFDRNAARMAGLVKDSGLKIRVATKSLRVPALIRRALNSSPVYQGLMCYAAREALFLSKQGFDDFLLAYPTVSASDLAALRELHESGKKISMVVDHPDHLRALHEVLGSSGKAFHVLLEVDLSLRLGPLVVGVRRSPLRTEEDVSRMIREIKNYPSLEFAGLMAYEAQVAGVGDRNPFKPLLSLLLGPLRRYSARRIRNTRQKIAAGITAKLPAGPQFIFNGGGTGSLSFNLGENRVLTELTAGSGFYCPHLFDYYSNLELEPAAFFALQAVRSPEEGWITCLGGGFIASGEPGWDRIPKPLSGRLSGFEAAGEVQTPLNAAGLKIGDAVIFRHAKAGEVMERFNEVILVENSQIRERVKTYRGFGECYF